MIDYKKHSAEILKELEKFAFMKDLDDSETRLAKNLINFVLVELIYEAQCDNLETLSKYQRQDINKSPIEEMKRP